MKPGWCSLLSFYRLIKIQNTNCIHVDWLTIPLRCYDEDYFDGTLILVLSLYTGKGCNFFVLKIYHLNEVFFQFIFCFYLFCTKLSESSYKVTSISEFCISFIIRGHECDLMSFFFKTASSRSRYLSLIFTSMQPL